MNVFVYSTGLYLFCLQHAQVGDLFVIHDTGAHGHSMGFQYNGKLRAPEVLLRVDGSVIVLLVSRVAGHQPMASRLLAARAHS